MLSCSIAAAAFSHPSEATAANPTIRPGEIWKDAAGDTINAHGGGVIFADGKYYWYGEHRASVRPNPQEGVNVYSSPNLTDWIYERPRSESFRSTRP